MYKFIVKLSIPVFIFSFVLFLFNSGCGNKDRESKQDSTTKIILEDKPISDTQKKLLDVAFETASLMPHDPHIKDRSRLQEQVVMTCLKLDQPQKARRYIKEIDSWRRNLCYAQLALYCAENKKAKEAEYFLKITSDFPEVSQEWHLNRIKARMSKAYRQLNQSAKAKKLSAQTEENDETKVYKATESFYDEDTFQSQISYLDGIVKTQDFDLTRAALNLYAKLYNDIFSDQTKRAIVEGKVKSSWEAVPTTIRMNTLIEMAEYALEHSDQSTALHLIDEADGFFGKTNFPTDIYIFMKGKISGLRFKAGDVEGAQSDAEEVLTYFDDNYKKITDIYRAGTLRPLAESFYSMGNTEKALSVYKRAVEEGIVNPNSRPRAEDLSATCCSMALIGFEPDTELWARIHQIKEGLGEPW